jgi:hypothetical protein
MKKSLCQHPGGGCSACCGIYNFAHRDFESTRSRLLHRTHRVEGAQWDAKELASVRDGLLAEESADILFAGVKVCPFAGYIDEEGERVGCLIHPTRHPEGKDLRDLGVYNRHICEDHLCGPHDWLRPAEVALAKTAPPLLYGQVVTDAGLVKGLARWMEVHLARSLRPEDVAEEPSALSPLWDLVSQWPHRDPDPHRFGGIMVSGEDEVERTLPSCLAGLGLNLPPHVTHVLDALASRIDSIQEADAAIAALDRCLDQWARGLDKKSAGKLRVLETSN